jgi:hypothetical protein
VNREPKSKILKHSETFQNNPNLGLCLNKYSKK